MNRRSRRSAPDWRCILPVRRRRSGPTRRTPTCGRCLRHWRLIGTLGSANQERRAVASTNAEAVTVRWGHGIQRSHARSSAWPTPTRHPGTRPGASLPRTRKRQTQRRVKVPTRVHPPRCGTALRCGSGGLSDRTQINTLPLVGSPVWVYGESRTCSKIRLMKLPARKPSGAARASRWFDEFNVGGAALGTGEALI